jgi:hypothetical protein
MSTHVIRTRGRTPTATVGIFLALALAVSVLAIQGHSIWSTAAHPVFLPASVRMDPNPSKDDLRLGDLRRYGTSGGSFHRISTRQIEARKSG